MDGPYGSRRVTYADYTASRTCLGFLEDFVREEVLPRYANTHTESSGTGLQTTRLREDARAIIHEAVGGDDDTGDLLRLGRDRRDRQADRDAQPAFAGRPRRALRAVGQHPGRRAAGGLHRPVRAPLERAALARVDRRRGRDPGGLRRPHRRRRTSRRSSCARRSPDQDRVVLGGVERDRHRHRHPRIADLLHRHGALAFWDFAAAGSVCRHRDEPARRASRARYKDAVFLSPAQVHRRPGHARRAGRPTRAARRTRFPTWSAAARSPTSTRGPHVLDDPVHARRAARRRSSSRSAPGSCSSSRRRSGVEMIRAHEEDFLRRAIAAWDGRPGDRVLGNVDAERLSIVSFVVRTARAATSTTTSSSRCSTICSASRRAAAVRAPGRTDTDCSASTSSARTSTSARSPDGCEGIKPGWVRVNFNYFISRGRLPLPGRCCRTGRRSRLDAAADYRFDPVTGLWRHRWPRRATASAP